MGNNVKHRSIPKSVARFAALVAVLAALAVFLLPPPASAQFRTLPNNAERGYIRHVEHNVVAIDGKKMRLAPGATIRDRRNLIIFANTLPEEGATAEYLIDRDGHVARVWLLTPQEEARKKPKK